MNVDGDIKQASLITCVSIHCFIAFLHSRGTYIDKHSFWKHPVSSPVKKIS